MLLFLIAIMTSNMNLTRDWSVSETAWSELAFDWISWMMDFNPVGSSFLKLKPTSEIYLNHSFFYSLRTSKSLKNHFILTH